jgi:predicted metallo-beta-lactamase superfamily hydrolase
MNLKKIILQIGTLSFCTSIIIFAIFNISVHGIVNISFIIFIIATGTATYYLVKRYPLPKEEEENKKIEPIVEEEIISEHVISIDRTEVIKMDSSSESKEKKGSSKKATSEMEEPEEEE